jgi:hypothetical protein
MKNLLKILTAITGKHIEKWIFGLLSGTFRLGSRMFLVCFSFLLRSNLLPDGFELALKQVCHLFARRYLCADSWFGYGGIRKKLLCLIVDVI